MILPQQPHWSLILKHRNATNRRKKKVEEIKHTDETRKLHQHIYWVAKLKISSAVIQIHELKGQLCFTSKL